MLQVERSLVRVPMRSLHFVICVIPPPALWPWGLLSLKEKSVPEYFLGGKVRPVREADNLIIIYEPIF
jgi:hypothetical protein